MYEHDIFITGGRFELKPVGPYFGVPLNVAFGNEREFF